MNTHPYPSDLTNEEWVILAPLITPGTQAGHPQVLELRRIVDAVFYLLRTGCQWRALPHDFPSWSSVFYHYAKWRSQGTWEQINTRPGRGCAGTVARADDYGGGSADDRALDAGAGRRSRGC